eukprot:SAG11_NODE_18070_length_500_cov_3.329177_1_plen_62_part_10
MMLMRFAVWLPRNGIKSGWKGVKNYTGGLVQASHRTRPDRELPRPRPEGLAESGSLLSLWAA